MELVGMGMSPMLKEHGFDRGGWESAQLRVHSDGKVTLFSGSMSQGHGHATSYAQIVGDVLQLRWTTSTWCRATLIACRPGTAPLTRARCPSAVRRRSPRRIRI